MAYSDNKFEALRSIIDRAVETLKLEKSTAQSTALSTPQSMVQSTAQTIIQSTAQTMVPSTGQSTAQAVNQSIAQSSTSGSSLANPQELKIPDGSFTSIGLKESSGLCVSEYKTDDRRIPTFSITVTSNNPEFKMAAGLNVPEVKMAVSSSPPESKVAAEKDIPEFKMATDSIIPKFPMAAASNTGCPEMKRADDTNVSEFKMADISNILDFNMTTCSDYLTAFDLSMGSFVPDYSQKVPEFQLSVDPFQIPASRKRKADEIFEVNSVKKTRVVETEGMKENCFYGIVQENYASPPRALDLSCKKEHQFHDSLTQFNNVPLDLSMKGKSCGKPKAAKSLTFEDVEAQAEASAIQFEQQASEAYHEKFSMKKSLPSVVPKHGHSDHMSFFHDNEDQASNEWSAPTTPESPKLNVKNPTAKEITWHIPEIQRGKHDKPIHHSSPSPESPKSNEKNPTAKKKSWHTPEVPRGGLDQPISHSSPFECLSPVKATSTDSESSVHWEALEETKSGEQQEVDPNGKGCFDENLEQSIAPENSLLDSSADDTRNTSFKEKAKQNTDSFEVDVEVKEERTKGPENSIQAFKILHLVSGALDESIQRQDREKQEHFLPQDVKEHQESPESVKENEECMKEGQEYPEFVAEHPNKTVEPMSYRDFIKEIRSAETSPDFMNNDFVCGGCSKDFRCEADLVCHFVHCSPLKAGLRPLMVAPTRDATQEEPLNLKVPKLEIAETDDLNVMKPEALNLQVPKLEIPEACRLDVTKPDADVNGGFKCRWCNKTFLKPFRVRRHERMVHCKERPHVCPVCAKAFAQSSDLRKHKVSIHKMVLCTICHKVFINEEEKQAHCSGAHQNFKCEVCGTYFLSDFKLACHKQMKHGKGILTSTEFTKDKSHNIPQSPRQLINQGQGVNQPQGQGPNALQKEVKVENSTGTQPTENFELDLSPGPLMIVENPVELKKLNIGGKFQCSICRENFKSSSELNKHRLSHNFLKVYSCKLCDKHFKRSSNLRQHEGTFLHLANVAKRTEENQQTSVVVDKNDEVKEEKADD